MNPLGACSCVVELLQNANRKIVKIIEKLVFKRALIFIYNFESIYLRIPLVYINGKILVWTLENWTLLPNFKKSRSTNQSNCVELLKWILRNSLLELQIKFKFEICWTSTGGWKWNLCETFFMSGTCHYFVSPLRFMVDLRFVKNTDHEAGQKPFPIPYNNIYFWDFRYRRGYSHLD